MKQRLVVWIMGALASQGVACGEPLVRNGWPLGGLERVTGTFPFVPDLPPAYETSPKFLKVKWSFRNVGHVSAPPNYKIKSLQVTQDQIILGYHGLATQDPSGAIEVIAFNSNGTLNFERQLILPGGPIDSAIEWQGALFFISQGPGKQPNTLSKWVGKVGSERRSEQPTLPTALWEMNDTNPHHLYTRNGKLFISVEMGDEEGLWEKDIGQSDQQEHAIGFEKLPSWAPAGPQNVVRGGYIFTPQGEGGVQVVCESTGDLVAQLPPPPLEGANGPKATSTRALSVYKSLLVTSQSPGGLHLYRVTKTRGKEQKTGCAPVNFQWLSSLGSQNDAKAYTHVELFGYRLFAATGYRVDVFNLEPNY